MNQNPNTTPATAPEPFPMLSRWLDRVDEALSIGTHRPEAN